MANIITAGNSTNGGTAITTDTSGTLDIKTGTGSGTTAISVDASQNVTTAANLTVTGSITGGSISVANSLRAWVNFNGTGTVAIRASNNVSSITDNGTGEYTVNFTTALSDANYAANININMNYGATLVTSPSLNTQGGGASELAPSTSSFRFYCALTNNAAFDPKYVNVSVFR